jgi:hypothetical protein
MFIVCQKHAKEGALQDLYYGVDYDNIIQSKKVYIELNVPLNKLSSNVITKGVKMKPKHTGYKGGAIPLSFENADITQFLINEWLQIPSHAGFETTTLSIFNPSFLKLFEIDGVETYICTCRVIYHYEDNKENTGRVKSGEVPRPMNDAERETAYSMLNGQYIIGKGAGASSKQNDDHPYIIHPGSALATPWYNPRGFWAGTYTDNTMVCVLKIIGTEIFGIDRFIPAYHGSCPIDARIFGVHLLDLDKITIVTVFITGSMRRGTSKDINLGIISNTIDPSAPIGNFNGTWATPAGGWKHGLLRLKYFFNKDGTVRTKQSIDDIIKP